MDSGTRTLLETLVHHGESAYRETAQALLRGDLVWSHDDVARLIDAFANDPYLTR